MGNFVFPNLAGIANKYRPGKTSASRGEVKFVGEEITVAAADLTLNALFGNIRLPKGAVVIGVDLMSTDIDTNGSPAVVLAVGDSGSAARLISGATVGQAGGITSTIATTGYGFQCTAETLVQIKVMTAPGTAAAGTLTYGVRYVTP